MSDLHQMIPSRLDAHNRDGLRLPEHAHQLLDALEPYCRGRGRYDCPACGKKNRLIASMDPAGVLLIYCQGLDGCTAELIVWELGLSLRDLFPPSMRRGHVPDPEEGESPQVVASFVAAYRHRIAETSWAGRKAKSKRAIVQAIAAVVEQAGKLEVTLTRAHLAVVSGVSERTISTHWRELREEEWFVEIEQGGIFYRDGEPTTVPTRIQIGRPGETGIYYHRLQRIHAGGVGGRQPLQMHFSGLDAVPAVPGGTRIPATGGVYSLGQLDPGSDLALGLGRTRADLLDALANSEEPLTLAEWATATGYTAKTVRSNAVGRSGSGCDGGLIGFGIVARVGTRSAGRGRPTDLYGIAQPALPCWDDYAVRLGFAGMAEERARLRDEARVRVQDALDRWIDAKERGRSPFVSKVDRAALLRSERVRVGLDELAEMILGRERLPEPAEVDAEIDVLAQKLPELAELAAD